MNGHARDKQADANKQGDEPTTRLRIHCDGLRSSTKQKATLEDITV